MPEIFATEPTENLPPDSSDLNPIEMAFSKLQAHLRRIGARTFDQMFGALAEVCDLFTPQECWNYFATQEMNQVKGSIL